MTITTRPTAAPAALPSGGDVLALYALVLWGWGTSWIFMRMQVGVVAPEVSVFWRFLMAAPIMFVWVAARGERLRFPWRMHLRFALMGMLMFSTNFVLFYYGSLWITSGLLSVVFSLASVFNLLLGAVVLGQKADWRLALGGLMGFSGVALMFWPEFQRTNADSILALGLGLCVLGTICFCSGNMLSARNQRDGVSVLSANAWSMAYGAIYLFVLGTVRGHVFMVEWTPKYLGSLAYLTLVSTVLAFAAYLTLLGRIGAARAGYATVLFPVVALIVSTFAETWVGMSSSNYVWTVSAFAGIALVLAGNVLVLRR